MLYFTSYFRARRTVVDGTRTQYRREYLFGDCTRVVVGDVVESCTVKRKIKLEKAACGSVGRWQGRQEGRRVCFIGWYAFSRGAALLPVASVVWEPLFAPTN